MGVIESGILVDSLKIPEITGDIINDTKHRFFVDRATVNIRRLVLAPQERGDLWASLILSYPGYRISLEQLRDSITIGDQMYPPERSQHRIEISQQWLPHNDLLPRELLLGIFLPRMNDTDILTTCYHFPKANLESNPFISVPLQVAAIRQELGCTSTQELAYMPFEPMLNRILDGQVHMVSGVGMSIYQ